MNISQDVLSIIDRGRSDGNLFYLPDEQLERQMYLKVNKVLELLGGSWNRKQKAHVFEQSIEDAIESVLLTGEVLDLKKELQFFETPDEVIGQMIEMACITQGTIVCEPSAGKGAILKKLSEVTQNIVWCEIHEPFAEELKSLGIGKMIGSDFLNTVFTHEIDVFVMNPPFTRQQDIDHITKAIQVVRPNGIVVSVLTPAFKYRENRKTEDFKQLLRTCQHYETIDLPEGSFKESGTMVSTCLLKVIK